MHNPLEKNLLFNSETWKGIRIPYSYTKGKETSLSQTPLTRCHKLYSLTFLYAGNNVIIVDFASLCILKLPHMLRAWAILRVTLQRCVCACVRVCVCVCACVSVCERERERKRMKQRLVWRSSNSCFSYKNELSCSAASRRDRWKVGLSVFYAGSEQCSKRQRYGMRESERGLALVGLDHWSAHKMPSSRDPSHRLRDSYMEHN